MIDSAILLNLGERAIKSAINYLLYNSATQSYCVFKDQRIEFTYNTKSNK